MSAETLNNALLHIRESLDQFAETYCNIYTDPRQKAEARERMDELTQASLNRLIEVSVRMGIPREQLTGGDPMFLGGWDEETGNEQDENEKSK